MIRHLLRTATMAAALVTASVATAGTLIVNANGYDIDEQGQLQKFHGLFIDDEGRIARILKGRDREPKLDRGDYRLDAQGRTIIPGLIDSHMHLLAFGSRQREPDLRGASDLTTIFQMLARHVQEERPRRWLNVHGWQPDPDNLPTASDLDAHYPDLPVWIRATDGQTGWANSAAMLAAGISANSKAPTGGHILRGEDDQPTGLFTGTAMALIARHQPAASAGEQEKALSSALAALGRLGITTVHDMGITAADWALYRSFGDRGALTVRIAAYAEGVQPMEIISPLRPTPWLYADRLKLHGIKFRIDGRMNGHDAWLQRPYVDAPDQSGVPWLDDTKARNLLSRANFLGYQTAVHAVGDAAIAQVLDSYADIIPAYGHGFRNRIEHADLLTQTDIQRLQELQIVVALQPGSEVDNLLLKTARLGPDRANGTPTLTELHRAGVHIVLGTGSPRGVSNPFAVIQTAIRQPYSEPDADQLTLGQLLAAFTTNAARAVRAERMIGRLSPGLWADFILLDQDPFETAPEQLQSIRVLETWLGGQRVFQQDQPAS